MTSAWKDQYYPKKRRGGRFNPSHEEIDQAVHDFLDKGGKIKHIKPSKQTYHSFIATTDFATSLNDLNDFFLEN